MFLDNITSDILVKALDLTVFKHRVVSNNIANFNVEGYTRKSVQFNEVMKEVNQAVESNMDNVNLKKVVQSVNIDPITTIENSEADVEIAQEMLDMTENMVRYQSLLRMYSEYGNIVSSAISGGK